MQGHNYRHDYILLTTCRQVKAKAFRKRSKSSEAAAAVDFGEGDAVKFILVRAELQPTSSQRAADADSHTT